MLLLNPIRTLAAMAAVGLGISGTVTALTQEEVNAALGGQPGLNWTITGVHPESWSVGNSLNGSYLEVWRYVDTDRSSYELKTTLTGPGVLEISRSSNYYISTSILLDGIQNGSNTPWTQYVSMRDRVVIPPGTHTVSWKSTFTIYQGYSSFSKAKWLPGRVDLPLQLGASGSAITLSGPWTGQNIWHHGDGGAAWSGLVPPVLPGSTPTSTILRGEFTGDGVLSFRCMPRGGPGRVRLDGGAWRNLSRTDAWTLQLLRVTGAGPHVVEFDAPSLVSDTRNHSELLVDELELLPVVDFSTALDTPDLVWTPTFTQHGTPAYGAAVEGARGGAVVVLDQSHLTTHFPQSALLKVRTLGDVQFRYEGTYIGGGTILSTETTPEGDWNIRAVEVNQSSTGNGELTIYSNTPGMVDYIEVVEKPATLEATVGMPPGTFRTGGDVPWKILPVTSQGSYAARSTFTRSRETGWMEHDVTGPAEILLECYTRDQDFRVLVNGRVTWTGGTNNFRQPVPVRIEVPTGQHVVRYESMVAGSHPNSFSETWISSMTVNALPEGGVTGVALDFPAPHGYSGTWTVRDAPPPSSGTALAPTPVPYGTHAHDHPTLVIPLTGPGYFRAASHISGYSYSASLLFSTSFNQSVQRGNYSTGWAGHTIWVPPGEHYLTITAPEATVKHLDGFSFVPSEYLTVEELVSGETAPLTVVPANQPWTGMKKQPDEPPVILSPMIEKDVPKRLSMTVNGPGVISFKWKTVNRAVGSFFIDGVPSSLTLSHNSITEESETLFIETGGPHTLEWEASFREYQSWKHGWMELRDVVWTPVVETPFAEALDGPAGSTWTTSPEHPFKGLPAAGAVGGTAATLLLQKGEESWLETTVEGAGVFSFAMVESIAQPDGPVTGYTNVVLEIDGEVHRARLMYEYGTTRHLILDGGTHTIRLKFSMLATQPYAVVAVAVDEVTWTPATETNSDPEWTSDAPGSLGCYPGMSERNGSDLVVLHPLAGGPQWIERTVTGPGLLTWESKKTPGMTVRRDYTLRIDGVSVTGLPVGIDSDGMGVWEKYELHVPPGTHTVRFAADTAPPVVPSSPSYDQPPSWQISGMAYIPGETDLMKGIDSMALPWLGFNPDFTELVEGSGMGADDDHFHSSTTAYHVINTSAERLLASALMGAPQTAQHATRILPPRTTVRWNPGNTIRSYDAFLTEVISTVSVDEALDIPNGTGSDGGWQGLAMASAHDGVDAAFSLLDEEEATATLTRSVAGSTRIRFRWKLTGAGTLAFSINGQTVPVSATNEWTEVDYYLDEGTHTLRWSHAGAQLSDLIPTASWVDTLMVEPIPQRTLDEAVGGPGFTLATTSPGTAASWRSVFREFPLGGWEDVAVTRSGEAIMSTTITGPAVLSFQGYVDQLAPYPDTESPHGPFRMTDYIEVKVGGVTRGKVFSIYYPQNMEILIPAGSHEVTWQLASTYMTWEGVIYNAPFTGDHLEAVVDDVSITTPQAHYDWWAGTNDLPSGKAGPREDADGDGVINFMEYAFRTDAMDATRMPVAPAIGFYPSMVDYSDPTVLLHLVGTHPAAHVSARLLQSRNLETWDEVETAPIVATPDQLGDGWIDLEFPVPDDGKPLFFRFEIDLPEEED